jgi:hypothetical protein
MSNCTGNFTLFTADAALRVDKYCFHTPVPFSKLILKQSREQIHLLVTTSFWFEQKKSPVSLFSIERQALNVNNNAQNDTYPAV